ncbi:CBS domain-containing protein [Nocardiopsis mwathae]|uniref:CBS domain-containing protein n=1 Tax=Nocardiopsis mwathae TaxID=1472723 RepID=A0A7W9YH98_9ACTN|nr:CBS domain-containing protein [Nocardiopsis mwathae]MBB6171930.1 CBS domain-containing protein [Nocardiopsis mwathae]
MTATVRDVMTTDVVTIGPDTAFKDIANCIITKNVAALPVVDRGRVVGVVSESDLVHKAEFQPEGDEGHLDSGYREPMRAWLRHALGGVGGASARDKALAEKADRLMSRNVVTAHPDASVVQAARVMDRYDVKQLPVVDEHGHLVGIVSRRDLLRVFVRKDADIARDVGTALGRAPRWLEPGSISFTVQDGMVTLEGRLEQHSHVPVLLQLVQSVDGIVGVHDRLTWNVDDLVRPRTPYLP